MRGLFLLKEIGAIDDDLTGSIDPVFLDIGFLHGDPAFLKHPGHLRAIAVEDPIQLFVCGYMREYFDLGVISQSGMMAVAAFHDADRAVADLTLSIEVHDMTVKSTIGKCSWSAQMGQNFF